MWGIHIHRGGDSWSWSQGCITIHDSSGNGDWARFMSYFNSNPGIYPNNSQKPVVDGYGNTIGLRTGQRAGDITINF